MKRMLADQLLGWVATLSSCLDNTSMLIISLSDLKKAAPGFAFPMRETEEEGLLSSSER